MATFNFTIRATDNAGAFADREFSLNVRKTNIERLMYVGEDRNIITAPSFTGPLTTTLDAGKPYMSYNENFSWNSFAYGNGVWLQQMSSSTQYLYSTNGLNWEVMTFPVNMTSFPGFTFANGKFHVVMAYYGSGDNLNKWAYYTSVDGIAWTRNEFTVMTTLGNVVNPGSESWEMFIASNGHMIISQRGGTSYQHSTDGVSFTRRTFPTIPRRIKNYNGVWFVLDDGYRLYTSTDMISWTQVGLPTFAPGVSYISCSDITYGNGALIITLRKAPGNTGTTSWTHTDLSQYLYSTDGTNWSLRSYTGTTMYNSTFSSGGGMGSHHVLCTFVNGAFVVATTLSSSASYSGYVFSLDGINWSKISVPNNAYVRWLWSTDQANY